MRHIVITWLIQPDGDINCQYLVRQGLNRDRFTNWIQKSPQTNHSHDWWSLVFLLFSVINRFYVSNSWLNIIINSQTSFLYEILQWSCHSGFNSEIGLKTACVLADKHKQNGSWSFNFLESRLQTNDISTSDNLILALK